MRTRILFLLVTTLTSSVLAAGPDSAVTPVNLPAKSRFHLYLLLGQSNMAGRGVIGEEDKTPHPQVLMLDTNGAWRVAVEPVTHDKPTMLGVGPGLAFGKAMAEKHPDTVIGLVPCALGGSPLSRWQKGGDLYSNAVHRARLAMQTGTLQGMLWHQGESDSKPGLAKTYGARLAQMIRDLRADLGAPDLPVVAGQLGEFLYTRTTDNVPEAIIVNDAIARLPQEMPRTGFIRVAGLGHKGDQLHFNTAAQREMGRRFAAEMLRVHARTTE
jgi:hypothetical protein